MPSVRIRVRVRVRVMVRAYPRVLQERRLPYDKLTTLTSLSLRR